MFGSKFENSDVIMKITILFSLEWYVWFVCFFSWGLNSKKKMESVFTLIVFDWKKIQIRDNKNSYDINYV